MSATMDIASVVLPTGRNRDHVRRPAQRRQASTAYVTRDPEVECLARVAARDRDAFERLYAQYAPRILRFVFRMLRDEQRAEEVVNDVMLEVWKSAERFEGRSSVSTWILGIARNRALTAIRGREIPTTALDAAAEVVDEAAGPEEGSDRRTLLGQLRSAMQTLSPEQREVVELTFFHGLSYREIAEIAGCPEGTVKTRMFHAKRRLRAPLEAAGVAEAL